MMRSACWCRTGSGLSPDADEASRAAAIAIGRRRGRRRRPTDRPYLYELLDVTPPPEVRALLSAVDASVRRSATLDALSWLLRSQLALAPTLLLIEDIHWADTWTLEQLVPLLAQTDERTPCW